MIINDLEFYSVEIPCDGHPLPVRSVLVRVATDMGLEGWGEARLDWRPAELPRRREILLSILTGHSAFDVEELLELEALADARLRCALEMASWDLVGRAAGQPLCHLLGGAYRKRIPLAVRLPSAPPGQTVHLARELAEQGFHFQIVTSCGRLDSDLDTLEAISESSLERVELSFDAVAGYDMDSARDLCAELEDRGLKCVLDPLKEQQLDRIASLRRQTSVPVAVRRAIQSAADVLTLIRCGAAENVVVDLQQVGGLLRARQCAAVARAGGIQASLASGPALGVATAAMLQVAASTPAFAGQNESAYHQLEDDLLDEPLEIVDGMITVPQAPGLGVEIDRAKLERYQLT
jgi:L-alanine-DL-glutamate epimerase-like enolase superfamily enzyme